MLLSVALAAGAVCCRQARQHLPLQHTQVPPAPPDIPAVPPAWGWAPKAGPKRPSRRLGRMGWWWTRAWRRNDRCWCAAAQGPSWAATPPSRPSLGERAACPCPPFVPHPHPQGPPPHHIIPHANASSSCRVMHHLASMVPLCVRHSCVLCFCVASSSSYCRTNQPAGLSVICATLADPDSASHVQPASRGGGSGEPSRKRRLSPVDALTWCVWGCVLLGLGVVCVCMKPECIVDPTSPPLVNPLLLPCTCPQLGDYCSDAPHPWGSVPSSR